MCLFLNHLITKRSPLPTELKALSHPQPLIIFTILKEEKIQSYSTRETQSYGVQSFLLPSGGTSVQSKSKEQR